MLISLDISHIRRLLSLTETHVYFHYFKGKFQFRRDSWEARRCNRVSSATQCTAQQETVGVNISANQNLTAFGKLVLELWRGTWSDVMSRLICTDVTLQSSFTFWNRSWARRISPAYTINLLQLDTLALFKSSVLEKSSAASRIFNSS